MNSVDLTPLYRNSIGFDRLASIFDHAFNANSSNESYPPYDIEVYDDNKYSITLSVAGFSPENIDIQLENAVLTVSGSAPSKNDAKYLYHGIAIQNFVRKFSLADHIKITGAEMAHGQLTINLVKEVPEIMKPRTIPINQVISNQEDLGEQHLEGKKKKQHH